MDKIPFWEETYRNRDINTFPAEPNGTILEFEHLLRKDSVILEAGCGEGQNVRYLAKNGYSDIDAFDLSEAGISKLHWICEREGLHINAFTDAAGVLHGPDSLQELTQRRPGVTLVCKQGSRSGPLFLFILKRIGCCDEYP